MHGTAYTKSPPFLSPPKWGGNTKKMRNTAINFRAAGGITSAETRPPKGLLRIGEWLFGRQKECPIALKREADHDWRRPPGVEPREAAKPLGREPSLPPRQAQGRPAADNTPAAPFILEPAPAPLSVSPALDFARRSFDAKQEAKAKRMGGAGGRGPPAPPPHTCDAYCVVSLPGPVRRPPPRTACPPASWESGYLGRLFPFFCWECGLPARKGERRRARCPRSQQREPTPPLTRHPSKEGMGKRPCSIFIAPLGTCDADEVATG